MPIHHFISRRGLILFSVGLCLAVFTGSVRAEKWNVTSHVPADKFIIQSHRGAGELAEENTIEAFELGWKLGTYPESDLRTTSDGVIVAFHDENFSRVVKNPPPELAKKGVSDLTFKELSALDVGSWKGDKFAGRHVSRISEVFAKMHGRPERHLYLDIKNVDLKQLAGEVKEAGVQGQVVLASTKYEIIREWKSLVPESDTLLWMGGEESALRKRIEDLRKTNFADVTQLQVHVHLKKGAKPGEYPFTISEEFILSLSSELASRHILFQSLPYGGSTDQIYHQLLDMGVASFATDHPDVTRRAVKDYYSNHTPAGTKPD